MRRRLLKALPALASRGVMPWHICPDPPGLTWAEIDQFARDVKRESDQARNARNKRKR